MWRKGKNRLGLVFYLLWFGTMLLQGYFTELHADEAYYWKYSLHPAWGYFDHPPAIAMLIKPGYMLLANELGVRLFPILLGLATIIIWEHIVRPKNLLLFYSIVVSVGIFHFIGFLALPDAPFLFLASSFYLLLKKYLHQPGWRISLLLGINVALLLLSKYHGILVIGFALLPNLKLLRTSNFWLIVLVSISLLIPHALWQIDYGFPSFRYHLYERSSEIYQFSFTSNYLATQLLVFGPMISLLFYYSVWKSTVLSLFEKTLRFSFWACFAFFFLMTFKGPVEGHWTLMALIPAIYFSYQVVNERPVLRKFVFYQLPFSFLVILFMRLGLMVDIFPDGYLMSGYFNSYHSKEKRSELIAERSGGLPVVFLNSYKKAATYEFYTGKKSMSLNNLSGRKNQYDIWNYEDSLRGQDVMVVFNYQTNVFDTLIGQDEHLEYTHIHDFQSFSGIRIIPQNLPPAIRAGDTFEVKMRFETKGNIPLEIIDSKQNRSFIYYQFSKGEMEILQKTKPKLSNINLEEPHSIKVKAPLEKGKYKFRLSIKTGWFPATFNSAQYTIRVNS